jgi:hypothetical protein
VPYVDSAFVPSNRTSAERAAGTMQMLERVGRLTIRRLVSDETGETVAEVIGDKDPNPFLVTVVTERAAPWRIVNINLVPLLR